MISIITPTFNREVLLQRTVQSILDQPYKDWELIIVDDGSTDNTAAVVEGYMKDKRISYVKKENSGQADSLNVGVTYAKGEFITFLDSDDEAYPQWLQRMSESIDESTGIACCEANRKFSDGKMIYERFNVISFMGKHLPLKFTCGSFFIRRSLFNAVGGYDIELKSNIQTDLGYRLLLHLQDTSYKIVSVGEPLVQINIHAGPRIRTNWGKMVTGGVQFFNKHYDLFYKYDRKVLSFVCGSIAFYNYKLKKRTDAVKYILKAIRYNPLRWSNYLRVVRYACM